MKLKTGKVLLIIKSTSGDAFNSKVWANLQISTDNSKMLVSKFEKRSGYYTEQQTDQPLTEGYVKHLWLKAMEKDGPECIFLKCYLHTFKSETAEVLLSRPFLTLHENRKKHEKQMTVVMSRNYLNQSPHPKQIIERGLDRTEWWFGKKKHENKNITKQIIRI